VFSIGYDRSGSRLAVGAHNVTLWSTTGIGTGTRAEPPTQLTALVNPPPFGHSDGTEAMTPDGLLVATANSSGRVLVGRVTAGGFDDSTLRTFSAGTQTIEALAASPNGRLIAAGSDDGHVYLFDVSHPSNRTALPALKAGKEVAYVAFSPNGRYVAGASIDHRVHLWDISDPSNAKALPSLGGFTNYAWSVTFSPDSKLLAAGGADDKVIIWNITRPDRPKRVAGPMNGPSHYVFSLAFSPNGRTLAAAGGDGSVWTWALSASGSARPTTMLHVADVGGSTYAVAFSPDGATLAAGGSAGEVVLWGTDPDAAASAICAAGGDQLTRAEWAQYVPGVPYHTLCSSG
jgi:WD40 repeat protein